MALERQQGEDKAMNNALDAAYLALDECLDSLDQRIEVGDLAQTDKIWICRSIINALKDQPHD